MRAGERSPPAQSNPLGERSAFVTGGKGALPRNQGTMPALCCAVPWPKRTTRAPPCSGCAGEAFAPTLGATQVEALQQLDPRGARRPRVLRALHAAGHQVRAALGQRLEEVA